MKEIKAYIKTFKCEDITGALHAIDSSSGAGFSGVLGCGRGKAASSGYGDH
jgi:nitrogen regulatory protein PII